MANKRKVGIYGAGTPAGIELMRVLSVHPMIELGFVADDALAGSLVREQCPGLSVNVRLPFVECEARLAQGVDLVFSALGLKQADALLPTVVEQPPSTKIVDLSPWLRHGDAGLLERLRGSRVAPDSIRDMATPGMAWRNLAAIGKARAVSMHGPVGHALCIALAPLASKDLLRGVVTGVASVGRFGADPLGEITVLGDGLRPLKVMDDAQAVEAAHWLSRGADASFEMAIVTQLSTEPRSVLLTVFADIGENLAVGSLDALYRGYYDNALFVSLLGSPPEPRHVLASNRAHLAVRLAGNTVCVSVALDALGRGSSHAAIECANTMLALPEEAGLMFGGLTNA